MVKPFSPWICGRLGFPAGQLYPRPTPFPPRHAPAVGTPLRVRTTYFENPLGGCGVKKTTTFHRRVIVRTHNNNNKNNCVEPPRVRARVGFMNDRAAQQLRFATSTRFYDALHRYENVRVRHCVCVPSRARPHHIYFIRYT